MMKASELWKMTVDDRVRSLLKSESSQKRKDKGKGKGKTKCLTPQKLYSFYQDHNVPLSEDQVEQVMLQKKSTSNTSKASGKGSKPWNGKGTGKGKTSDQEKGKTQPQASKGKNKGKSSGNGKQAKGHSLKGVGKGKKQERFHRRRIQQRLEECTLRQPQSFKRARYFRCFEHLVAEAGMSCLYSCHQYHRVNWLVGTHNTKHRFRGRELPDLSHLTQTIRDTENKLRWREFLGQSESERLGFVNMMNKRDVLCNALQDPEVEQVIRFFPDLNIWCTEAVEKASVQRLKHPGNIFYQKKPELNRLALKPMKDFGLTAIPRTTTLALC